MTEPLGAAPLQGLPDGGQAEGLAGVDGDVEVGAMDELEGIEVAARREARLRSGDVEAHDALVAVAHGELGDLDRAGELAHGRDDGADDDGPTGLACQARAALEAIQPGLHDRLERQAPLRRQLRRVAHLGVDDAVGGQVLGALGGHPRDGLGRLHDRDRVAEALEVELQGLAVGTRAEPASQLGRVHAGQVRGSRSRRPAR